VKQSITKQQLVELDEKQRIELRRFVLEKFPSSRAELMQWEVLIKPPLPRLSIGHMIEFLQSEKEIDLFIDRVGSWEVELDHGKENRFSERSFEREELCDALWEAVKEILNNQ